MCAGGWSLVSLQDVPLAAELVFVQVQGREAVVVLWPRKAVEGAGGVLDLTWAHTDTFILISQRGHAWPPA